MTKETPEEPALKRRRGAQKRDKFSFRVTPQMRAALEAAAAQTGRPISEEIELRLEESFKGDEFANKQVSAIIKRSYEDIKKIYHQVAGGEYYFNLGIRMAMNLRNNLPEATDGYPDINTWLHDKKEYAKIVKSLYLQLLYEFEELGKASKFLNDPKLKGINELLSRSLEFDVLERAKVQKNASGD